MTMDGICVKVVFSHAVESSNHRLCAVHMLLVMKDIL